MDAGTNEILAGAAFFVGTVIATVIAYITKRPQPVHRDAVIAGVGLEIGNKQQQAEMNEHLKSMAESLRILADRKQAAFEDKVMDALERMEERERRN
jgi:hypothetical protein